MDEVGDICDVGENNVIRKIDKVDEVDEVDEVTEIEEFDGVDYVGATLERGFQLS